MAGARFKGNREQGIVKAVFTALSSRVGLLENAALSWVVNSKAKYLGKRPIAHKYREGKMQRTLKRELKVLEVVERETKASLTVSVLKEIQLIQYYFSE